jgi:ribose transport system substrate-binding protein
VIIIAKKEVKGLLHGITSTAWKASTNAHLERQAERLPDHPEGGKIMKRLLIGLLILTVGVSFATAAPATPDKFAAIGVIHPYFFPMDGAVKDFAAATGIAAIYQATKDFDMEQENTIIDGLTPQGYNGFALWPGHPYSVNTTITALKKQGIPVILIGGQAKLPTDAALCIATDVAASAAEGARQVIKAMGDKGNFVDILGMLSDPNTLLRKAAIEKVIKEHPQVKLLATISDTDSFEAATAKIPPFFAARWSEIDGAQTTAYVAAVVTSQYLAEQKNNKVKFVGIDEDQKVLDAIGNGYVLGTMTQAPYMQAYLALTGLDLLRQGYTVKQGKYFIDSGFFLLDKGNLDTWQDIIKDKTQKMVQMFKDAYFNAPKK